MPVVSSATKGRIKLTATDNEGHASSLEKEITITDVIVTIKPKDIVQGTPVNFSAVFVNTQDKTIDVLAEFTVNDSFGLTMFKDVDGSLTLPTGMKAQFTSQWTTEKYGTYDAITSIKKTDGTLIANRSETLVISLPKWGEISALNLPESAVKGTNLSYSIDFHNTGPVPYDTIAILSLIDERENTRLVMESEEKTMPEWEFNSVIKMNSETFVEVIEDCLVVSDACTFNASPNSFIVEASGLNSAKAEFNSDEIEIHSGNSTSRYSLEYLNKFIKGAKISSRVTLSFSNSHPMRLDFVTGNVILSFVLAPRIEQDD